MEEIAKIASKEANTELFKNTTVNISLEGWPCAIAVVGLSIAYVISIKIKYDSQRLSAESNLKQIKKVA